MEAPKIFEKSKKGYRYYYVVRFNIEFNNKQEKWDYDQVDLPFGDPTYDDIVKFRWGKAHQTRAPLEDFRSRINEYQRTEYQQDYEEIWNKYKSNIKIDM